MENFQETYSPPKLNQEEITEIKRSLRDHLNRPITRNETEYVIKTLPMNKNPGPDSFTGEFYKTYKELKFIILKLFSKFEEQGIIPKAFYEATIILIPKPDKDTTKKNDTPIFLMNIDVKILNKILTKQANLTTHKKDHIPRPRGIHLRFTKMVRHMQINQHHTPY